MVNYANVLRMLITILSEAVVASKGQDITTQLAALQGQRLITLSNEYSQLGCDELDTRLRRLTILSDESGLYRRELLSSPELSNYSAAFSCHTRDVLSSFDQEIACSFLFVKPNRNYLSIYFTIERDTMSVTQVIFNETIYNANDPHLIGTINLLNHVERGLNILKQY